MSDVKRLDVDTNIRAASEKYGLSSDSLALLASYVGGHADPEENERRKLLLRIINELIEHGSVFSEYLGEALYSPQQDENDRMKKDHKLFQAIQNLIEFCRKLAWKGR